MLLWRVSEFLELDGEGGRLFDGRWNRGGTAIVYTAESSALALLEVLVRLESRHVPAPFQLLRLEAPDGLAIQAFDGPPRLPLEESREWGEQWLAAGRTALARVPSVIAPHAFNLLLNPAHRDAAQVRLTEYGRYPWDERLFA